MALGFAVLAVVVVVLCVAGGIGFVLDRAADGGGRHPHDRSMADRSPH